MLPNNEKIDKLFRLIGQRVSNCHHVDVENCEIYNTTRNTQPVEINISYINHSKTFQVYQSLKNELRGKTFVLHL